MGMSEQEMEEFMKNLGQKPPSPAPTVKEKPESEEKKKPPKTTKPRSTKPRSTPTTPSKSKKTDLSADEKKAETERVLKILKDNGYLTKTKLKEIVKTIEEERIKLAKKFENPTKSFTFENAYLWFVDEVKENPDKFAAMMTTLKRWIDKEMEELLKLEAPEFHERWKMSFRTKASAETRKVREIFDFSIQFVESKLKEMLELMDSIFFDKMMKVIGESLE